MTAAKVLEQLRKTAEGQAIADVLAAVLREREAELACRERPWADRGAWRAWIEAMLDRRAAVDALPAGLASKVKVRE